jgi:cell wall-associated NlpC family hydrolase
MPASTSARRLSLQSLAITPLLTAALLLGTGGAPTASSQSSGQQSPASSQAVDVATEPVSLVLPLRLQGLRLAAAQVGKPYQWGAAGPYAFDCSGLVYYVYHTRLHHYLPRTANAQRLATTRIAKSQVLPGDLVFFMSGTRAYHVGVYAGSGRVWHAPRPGQRVMLSRIWTTSWQAGRVR